MDWSELGKRRYDELFASALPRPGSVTGMRCQSGEMVHARRDVPRQSSTPLSALRSTHVKPLRSPAPVFSPTINEAIDRSVRLLDADIPLLLQGETGTGKEVVARELHRRSARAGAPFIAVNCAALPESLIESELFGYLPGAFTGARRDGSPGLLREADGGTLFLDELGDMPLAMQSRLLRVLQEREVTPLGGSRAHPIDVTVIAATHRDLSAAAERGEFRADLYYRIAQSTLRLPALHEHVDLASVIEQLWRALGGDQIPMHLHPELVQDLANRRWPGNLRQLVGLLRSLMALGSVGSVVTRRDLPEDLQMHGSAQALPHASLSGSLESIELHAIDEAITTCDGNVAAAARKLGVSRSTIYRRLAQHGAD